MPRTPRNPGSGKAPFNGPARGDGWGGAAKGAGAGQAQPWTSDTPRPDRAPVERMHALNHDADEQAYRAEQRRLRRERLRESWEAVDALRRDKTHKDHYASVRDTIDRYEGKAVQRTEVTGADGGPIETRVETVNDSRPSVDTYLNEWMAARDADATTH